MIKSFLQTQDWLDFQKHIGRKTWRFDDGKIKANIIKHDLPFGKNYLYIPHGPEISFDEISGGLKNELSQFVVYLKNLAREEKSIYIKIEPLDDKVPEVMHGFKFKKSSKEIQAHKTVVLDISKPEEELLIGMHNKTRYNIKIAEKHGITITPSSDVDALWKLLQKTKERQKFSTHEKDYYKKLLNFFNKEGKLQAGIYLAMFVDKPIAGALILNYGNTCFYLHGGSDHDHRQMMAPYALHWSLIKKAKERGFRFYDFGGGEAEKWPGITRFKLGWGGKQIEYPGSFDLPISKTWYLIYKIARKMF